MATLDLVSQENKKVGSIDLLDDVFNTKVNVALVHQVIKAQLAGRRQGNAKTKTRTEVKGGGKKPYRQKGTGNARQGSTRAPNHVGGGQNFGPTPRDYSQKTPKEMMRGALRSALSDRLQSERLIVVDEFKFDAPKTKAFNEIMKKNFKLEKVLVVDDTNENLEKSGRNLKDVKVLRTDGVNVYDIVKHEWLIMTKGAVESVQGRLQPRKKVAEAKA